MLFTPLSLRDVTLPNRVGVSPMCQYSAVEGRATDWHFVHLGSRAVGRAGLVMFEATAVEPRGRISPGDLGLWEDAQIEPLARIVRFVEGEGSVACLQLAHAGRKASVRAPWEEGGAPLAPAEGGWQVMGPSALPFAPGYPVPSVLDEAALAGIVKAFAASARRALAAGFRMIELHAAHGYLLHEFLSPISNRREDRYGGSLENRARLAREVISALRAVWPERFPLLVRVSATDWVDGGWDADATVALARTFRELGVDLIDVSSGGMVATAAVPAGPGYQTRFAERIRREVSIPTAAVGMISTPEQADHVLRTGQADLVLLAREMLRDPYWALHAAQRLRAEVVWPDQYLRAR